MKFKEFAVWCNDRAADGCWGMNTAIYCIGVLKTIWKLPFWKREKVWKQEYEELIVREIVEPINKKMAELSIWGAR